MGVFLDTPWTGQTFSPPTPLDIAALEAAIVGQLQIFLSAALGPQMIEVTHFPDRPEHYEMRHRIGTAIVGYAGSSYGVIKDVAHVVQEREMLFDIRLRIRDLGWAFGGPPSGTSPGAYQIVELVRQGLLGFQPNTGCTPIRAVHDQFMGRDHDGGVWVYEIRFGTRTVVVENFAPPNFPLFIHGTMLEEGAPANSVIAGASIPAGTPITATQVQIAQYTFSGNVIALSQANISALVIKSTNLATTYVNGIDYSLNNLTGLITWLPAGSIPANATVAVSYAYSDVVTALASGGSVPFSPNN